MREYNARGKFLKKLIIPEGSTPAPFIPASLVAASDGYLYAVDSTNEQVAKFTLSGDYSTAWATTAPQPAKSPSPAKSTGRGIGATAKYVFVANPENRGVRVWSVDGHEKITDDLGGRLNGSNGAYQITTSRRGELLALDCSAAKVLRYKINFYALAPVPLASPPAPTSKQLARAAIMAGTRCKVDLFSHVVDPPVNFTLA